MTPAEIQALKRHIEVMPDELPFLWAEYTCKDGSGHTHAAGGDPMEDGIEGTATLLADSVAHCEGHVDKHNVSHAFPHSQEEVNQAYHSAFSQLVDGKAAEVYKDIKHKMELHAKWGGPVPAAVMLPKRDDPTQWEIMVTDERTGEPYIYPMYDNVMDQFPDPREYGARKNDVAGWTMPRRRRQHG
jgi:hypothetical protein